MLTNDGDRITGVDELESIGANIIGTEIYRNLLDGQFGRTPDLHIICFQDFDQFPVFAFKPVIFADFFEIFSGFMDVMTIEDSSDTCQISLSVESRLILLDRKVPLRYTQETQESRYPGDTFFSYVASLQDKKVEWEMGED